MEALDLHPRINAALKKAKLTQFDTILSLSGPDLQRSTQLSARDVEVLHHAVAKTVYRQRPVTALEIYNKTGPAALCRKSVTTGCDVLDAYFHGGLPSQALLEVAGESASGKTQLAMQLCLTVQLPAELGGLGGGAVFICTEDVFPNKRLVQMADLLKQRCKSDPRVASIAFTDHIFIEHAADLSDLWHCVKNRMPVLLSQRRVKLIIIDSIAALFRCEFTLGETYERAKKLCSFAAHLHKLATQFNIPVVCVNQVSDLVGESKLAMCDRRRKVTPALGLAWANQVTVRIMLSRTSQSVTVSQKNVRGNMTGSIVTSVRSMEIMFAPHLPPVICHYIIDAEGVKGLK